MVLDAGSRLLVSRRALHELRLAPDPDAPAARPLADGEARLAVERFALTANNVTYAAFGEAMQYWSFFPGEDPAWGCVPVWGFATVTESRAEGVDVGSRCYGFLPMGTHLVVRPAKVGARGFTDGSAHRAELAAVYNRYTACAADPGYAPEREGHQAVLRPLFTTSFLIDDFLDDNGFFGARQVLLSSASSKTAYGTAFCLSRRSDDRPAVIGLTSRANADFARGLGCYDAVLDYDDVTRLDPALPTVYVDLAGSTPLRRAVHERFAARLAYSMAVGGTHWDRLGGGGGLPGPKPQLFFAPAQVARRSGPPPAGWGPGGLDQRLGDAWSAFIARVDDPSARWLEIREAQGAPAIEAAWHAAVDGHANAREGLMLRF